MSEAKYTIALEGETAGDIHWGAPGAIDIDGVLYTQECWKMFDENRWSNIFEFVIRRQTPDDEVTLWRAYISRGKTESQDNCDFRDSDFIEFEKVTGHMVARVEYRTVV